MAESNGSLLPGLWRNSLHVTCGLTACTPGSAPGPTPGNEYGKTFFHQNRCCHNGRNLPWEIAVIIDLRVSACNAIDYA